MLDRQGSRVPKDSVAIPVHLVTLDSWELRVSPVSEAHRARVVLLEFPDRSASPDFLEISAILAVAESLVPLVRLALLDSRAL